MSSGMAAEIHPVARADNSKAQAIPLKLFTASFSRCYRLLRNWSSMIATMITNPMAAGCQ